MYRAGHQVQKITMVSTDLVWMRKNPPSFHFVRCFSQYLFNPTQWLRILFSTELCFLLLSSTGSRLASPQLFLSSCRHWLWLDSTTCSLWPQRLSFIWPSLRSDYWETDIIWTLVVVSQHANELDYGLSIQHADNPSKQCNCVCSWCWGFLNWLWASCMKPLSLF